MKSLALALVLISPSAFALDFTGIQNWTGSGANEAALVIDFADSGPAYAWGYRFDGSVSGLSMLESIAAADPLLEVELTTFSFGTAVTGLRYGSLARGGFEPGSQGFFGYFTAESTTALPATWTDSQIGAADRMVADESWDAYAWAPDFAGNPPRANVVPAPVPEPATCAALGLGALALLRRRRGKA